jgi:hypothetical protein
MDSCPVLQHGLLPDRQQPRPHPGISKTTQQLDGIYALFAVLRLAVVDTKAGFPQFLLSTCHFCMLASTFCLKYGLMNLQMVPF